MKGTYASHRKLTSDDNRITFLPQTRSQAKVPEGAKPLAMKSTTTLISMAVLHLVRFLVDGLRSIPYINSLSTQLKSSQLISSKENTNSYKLTNRSQNIHIYNDVSDEVYLGTGQ